MTGIDVDSLTGPEVRPEPKRDRWGRYLLVNRETGVEQGWTRATTMAGTIKDTFGLTAWQCRLTAMGIVARPDLFAQAAAISDPDDESQKKTLNGLVKQAQETAGRSVKANLGTAVHAFAESVDLGREVTIPPPYDKDVAAYRAEIVRQGISIKAVEGICMVPEYGVAGTFDRIVGWEGDFYIADLKTGSDLSYSWPEIAIQLALYAHATQTYDPATDTYAPMPQVNQSTALVFHLPVGAAHCTIYELDITEAWQMVKVCEQVRAWRKVKGLATKLIEPLPISGGSRVAAEGASTSDGEDSVTPVATPGGTDSTPSAADPEAVYLWLRGRAETVAQAGHMHTLAAEWPDAVPTFREVTVYTDEHAKALDRALAKVERRHGLPFPESCPLPDNGEPAEVIDLAKVRRSRELVPGDAQVIQAIRRRWLCLDAETVAELEAKHKGVHLTTGTATRAQVAAIAMDVRRAFHGQ